MPSFGADLVSEIEFASSHFDFVEITYNPEERYGQERIRAIREALAATHAVGHLHWGCDFSQASEKEIGKAIKQLELFNVLGIMNVTAHPSFGGPAPWAETVKNNIISLAEIAKFCRATGMSINMENVADAPDRCADGMARLFSEFPEFGFTLDTGHAEITHGQKGYKKFLAGFGKRLSHAHVHYSSTGMDHLPFPDKSQMKSIIGDIAKVKQNITITFELFYDLLNGERVRLGEKERREIVLGYLRYLKP